MCLCSQGVVRDRVNANLAARLSAYDLASCPSHDASLSGSVDYLDWADARLLGALDAVLNTALGASGLNALFACLTNGTGAATFTTPAGTQVTLGGLDSIYEFELLAPLSDEGLPQDLASRLAVGFCPNSSACRPFSLALNGTGPSGQPLVVQLVVENLDLYLDVLVTSRPTY